MAHTPEHEEEDVLEGEQFADDGSSTAAQTNAQPIEAEEYDLERRLAVQQFKAKVLNLYLDDELSDGIFDELSRWANSDIGSNRIIKSRNSLDTLITQQKVVAGRSIENKNLDEAKAAERRSLVSFDEAYNKYVLNGLTNIAIGATGADEDTAAAAKVALNRMSESSVQSKVYDAFKASRNAIIEQIVSGEVGTLFEAPEFAAAERTVLPLDFFLRNTNKVLQAAFPKVDFADATIPGLESAVKTYLVPFVAVERKNKDALMEMEATLDGIEKELTETAFSATAHPERGELYRGLLRDFRAARDSTTRRYKEQVELSGGQALPAGEFAEGFLKTTAFGNKLKTASGGDGVFQGLGKLASTQLPAEKAAAKAKATQTSGAAALRDINVLGGYSPATADKAEAMAAALEGGEQPDVTAIAQFIEQANQEKTRSGKLKGIAANPINPETGRPYYSQRQMATASGGLEPGAFGDVTDQPPLGDVDPRIEDIYLDLVNQFQMRGQAAPITYQQFLNTAAGSRGPQLDTSTSTNPQFQYDLLHGAAQASGFYTSKYANVLEQSPTAAAMDELERKRGAGQLTPRVGVAGIPLLPSKEDAWVKRMEQTADTKFIPTVTTENFDADLQHQAEELERQRRKVQ